MEIDEEEEEEYEIIDKENKPLEKEPKIEKPTEKKETKNIVEIWRSDILQNFNKV